MKKEHLQYLACPACAGDLSFGLTEKGSQNHMEAGIIACSSCGREYPVIRSIPRFVPLENYASGFGYEWMQHARTQYDSATGLKISEQRFFAETKWDRSLPGQTILEVGSGSGRFTEIAATTGAMVVSVDYSYAVEANFASNGNKDNVLVVQGDIFSLPVKRHFFDKCYCFGVLQHTPDPRGAFLQLPEFLKPGGSLAADVYKKPDWWKRWFYTKYFARYFVKGIAPERLYKICRFYIKMMWPLSRFFAKLPFGKQLNWFLLIADYRGYYDLTEEQLKDWALLDTFDMLSPAFDLPQSLETFRGWYEESGLTDIDVHFGYNGIEGRARKQGAS